MKPSLSAIEQLRARGHRLTKLRVALIELFATMEKPISAKALLARLAKNGLEVNKTSVYRELEFLQAQGIVKTVLIGGTQTMYEHTRDHHHHVICRSCETVEDIHIPVLEQAVDRSASALKKSTGFSDIEHSLEFFGICHSCR